MEIYTLISLLKIGVLNAIQIYSFIIIISILMSWVPSARETKIGQIIERITEPYLSFFRKFIPPLGMIDISPIVALLALQLISSGVLAVFSMILTSSLL